MTDTESVPKRTSDLDEYEEPSPPIKKFRGVPGIGAFQLRLLLVARRCDAIIGKGGEVISRLRKDHDVDLVLPATHTPDRVLTIRGKMENCINVVEEILPCCSEAPFSVNQKCNMEINILVHTESVGAVIGKGGAKIKEIREESKGKIKVYQDCLPNSNERVVAIGGDDRDQIIAAVKIVLCLLKERPYRALGHYDPTNKETPEGTATPGSLLGPASLLGPGTWDSQSDGGFSFDNNHSLNQNNYSAADKKKTHDFDDNQICESYEITNMRYNIKDEARSDMRYNIKDEARSDMRYNMKDEARSDLSCVLASSLTGNHSAKNNILLPRNAKEEVALNQTITLLQSILDKKKPEMDADEGFGQTVGLTLKEIPDKKTKEFAKLKIQEVLYQAQYGQPASVTQVVQNTHVQQASTTYNMSPPRNSQYSNHSHSEPPPTPSSGGYNSSYQNPTSNSYYNR